MFKNGEKVDEFVGYKQKDVVMAMINKHVWFILILTYLDIYLSLS